MSEKSGWQTLPKIELHSHIGGAARVRTIQEMLISNGMDQDKAGVRASEIIIPKDDDGVLHEPPKYEGFRIISEGWSGSLPLLKQIVIEHLEDMAEDGCYYIELRTGGGSLEKLNAVLDAMNEFEQSEKRSFLCARLIVSLKRDEKIDVAWRAVKNAVQLKPRGVKAIDVCGVDPWLHPLSPEILEVIQWAKEEGGLHFVPHFAESVGETDLNSILSLNPIRLGHAVHLDWGDKETGNSDLQKVTKEVKEKRILVECCLSSNLNTMRRDGHLPNPCSGGLVEAATHHPLVWMWNQRHPFVLCTDNLGLLQIPLSEIYQIAANAIFQKGGGGGMTVESIGWKLATQAIEESTLEKEEKERIKKSLDLHPWAPTK